MASRPDAVFELIFGEHVTSIGEASIVYSGITYGLSFLGCYAGVVQ